MLPDSDQLQLTVVVGSRQTFGRGHLWTALPFGRECLSIVATFGRGRLWTTTTLTSKNLFVFLLMNSNFFASVISFQEVVNSFTHVTTSAQLSTSLGYPSLLTSPSTDAEVLRRKTMRTAVCEATSF